MSFIGTAVIYLVMACALVGAIGSLFNDKEGVGKEFLEGLYAIGYIFIPVAGIMASIPILSKVIVAVFGPVFAWVGADPAIAATSIIAVDMGGYQLADTLAATRESWIMAMTVGYMAGATIVFSIPVGLAMLKKEDHRYMALGVMSGILAVPFGVLISCTLLILIEPSVRETVSTQGVSAYLLHLDWATVAANLAPLVLFVVVIAVGLRFFPDNMIRLFMGFGKFMDIGIRMVLVCSIIEYFTQFFSTIFGGWGFDPIIADEEDTFRALEIAGYIGIMLSGAFPMVYLIKKFLGKGLEAVGKKLGLEGAGAAGLLASVANILAMFRLIEEMRPQDKVINIAFAVCGAFLFGDHLAFTANFQPNLILPIMVGKLGGGMIGIALAYWLSVPKAIELGRRAPEKA